MHHRSILLALLPGVVLSQAVPVHAADERQPTSEQVRFFETRIRPLLADNCYSCHGPDKQKYNLRLDSWEGMLRGGTSGTPPVVAGQPEKSLLIRAVRRKDDMLKMPPKRRLSDRQIADLTRWVQMGVPYPENSSIEGGETGRIFWAFQPLADPPLPAVKDVAWARTPLDRFVLAQLEANGLQPTPPADQRTLIRRATFDLTGLPPTSPEIEAFLADESPDAFSCVVDRLLVSPAYGERWNRHWLDIARYADSNGLDENVAHSDAFVQWDEHSDLKKGHEKNAREVDKPIAGLLRDLKSRGLLEDTLVLWGGEFGRTPTVQGGDGRDHNPEGFTMWLAGGGIKGGFRYGATDNYGYYAVENKVHIHDLHATLLYLLGLDHERLTYRHGGRDFRLTDVHGEVVKEILA